MFSNFFRDLIHTKTEQDRIQEYLAESVDLVDLENRLRKIDRNEAPWQVRNQALLRGWSY